MIGPFPNLLIAGVPKAGTSSLYAWLVDHPQALGSYDKETCFFADPDSHTFRKDFNAGQGLDAYRTAFPEPHAESRVLFEATPSYIYSQTALAHVPDLPSQPRCLFVVRDPASQIRSVYRYFRDNWDYIPADMSFDSYLGAVRQGSQSFGGNELASRALTFADYGPWLRAWRDRLGPERMKVCTFDQLQSDPAALMTDIAGWCGLDPSFYGDYRFRAENDTYVPRNRAVQKLNIAVRGYLPKGRIYQAAKRAYRRLNTRAPERGGDDAVLLQLRQEFAPANRQLAADFNLNLSGWMP